MKTFFKQRGKSTGLILINLGLALYGLVVDLICWILQLLGYGLLFLNYGIRKLHAISVGQGCLYNLDLEENWKKFDSDFIERRKIKKCKKTSYTEPKHQKE